MADRSPRKSGTSLIERFLTLIMWAVDQIVTIICVFILFALGFVEFNHLRKDDVIGDFTPMFEKHYQPVKSPPYVISYFLLPPLNYDPQYRYPLVLVLHDWDQKAYAAIALAQPDLRARHPAFVLVPVISSRSSWATPQTEQYRLATSGPRFSDALPQALSIIEDLRARYMIDANRIYVTGNSLGGYGTYGALARYPDYFAGALALSGAWDIEDTPNIARTPLWAFHGAEDRYVIPDIARDLMAGAMILNPEVKWSEVPHVGQTVWKQVYGSQTVWDWLFSQEK